MPKVNLGKDTSGRPLVLDDTTLAKIRWAEAQLGIKLSLIQGSYRAGPGALSRSGGTHDAGGAVDLRSWDIPKSIGVTRVLTALRQSGLIAWHRWQSVFPDHEIHCLDYGNPGLSPAARAQVVSWSKGLNGLASAGPDDGPKVAIPKTVPNGAPPVTAQQTTYGIDVSHYNAIDIAAAKKQGYSFFTAKCTEGSTYVDTRYAANRNAAQKAGVLYSAYHFLHHGNVDAQAANLAAHIGDKTIPYDVDAEAGGKPTWADITGFIAACKKHGLTLGRLYLPASYWNEIGRPNLSGYTVWNASYPSSKSGYGSALYPGNDSPRWASYGGATPMFWQFASSARMDGYSGSLDVNAFRGTLEQVKALGVFKDYGAKTPAPTKPAPAKPVEPTKPTLPMPPATQRDHVEPAWKGDRTADLARVATLPAGTDGIKAADRNFQWAWDDPKHLVADKPGYGTAFCLHYARPGQDNFKFIVDGNTVRAMTPAELDRPILEWSAADVLNWRRALDANSERPATYYEMVTEAVKQGVVICAELKSDAFALPGPAAQIVQAAKKAGHPPWFMALYRTLPNAKGKVSSIVRAGGSCAVIFGGNKVNRALYLAASTTWPVKPTRVW